MSESFKLRLDRFMNRIRVQAVLNCRSYHCLPSCLFEAPSAHSNGWSPYHCRIIPSYLERCLQQVTSYDVYPTHVERI